MLFNTIANTDLNISRIGLGGAAFSGEGKGYGFGPITEKDSIYLIQKALESEINLIDTAPVYGFGMSEIRIGKAIKDRREQCTLINKAGVTWEKNKHIRIDNSPKVITRMLNQSLKDLKTDFIDIYMLHWPDPETPLNESLEVLLKEKTHGKIKHIGFSNPSPMDLTRALEIADIRVIQGEFSYLNPSYFNSIKDIIQEHEIAFTGWGTFDKGIITGRVTKDRKFPGSDARSWAPWWKSQNLDEKLEKIEILKTESSKKPESLLSAALEFVLKENLNHCSLCGIRSTQQLDSLIDSINKFEKNN